MFSVWDLLAKPRCLPETYDASGHVAALGCRVDNLRTFKRAQAVRERQRPLYNLTAARAWTASLSPSTANVTDLVDGLHGKVERHKLANGLDAAHGCADGNARKARLCDGRVNHALPSEGKGG